MIPFAILSGEIQFSDTTIDNLEIRILDLSPNDFTFRLPLYYMSHLSQISRIVLHFFQYKSRSYQDVMIDHFQIEIVEEDNFSVLLRLNPEEAGFFHYGESVVHLTKEYLSYIDKKLTLTDEELSASLSDYPYYEEEEYASDLSEQIHDWGKEIYNSVEQYWKMRFSKRNSTDVESKIVTNIDSAPSYCYSLLLDHPEKIEKYLNTGMLDYIQKYMESILKKEDSENLIRKMQRLEIKVTGLHIGNAFCPHLLPENALLKLILRKAQLEQLDCTYIIPPVAQSIYTDIIDGFIKIHDFLREKNMYLTIEVNDLGMKNELSKSEWNHFSVISGTFLHKKTRDSRMKYRYPDKHIKNYKKDFYLDYSDDAVYFPLYQTNTATFCSTYSMLHYGERQKMKRVKECQRECLHHCYLYPKHLHMIGKYNSLFACETSLRQLCLPEASQKKWLVINL